MEYIKIRGARTHNLKNISLTLPRGKLIVVTGLSGSGKSALLYALLEAFPKEHYLTIHQTTGKSLYNNPNINKTKYWIKNHLKEETLFLLQASQDTVAA